MSDELHKKYLGHRGQAKQRGIPFRLSFDQWLKIWRDSGHLESRGRRRGEYVMARFGDKGAYEIGNVRIILATENALERISLRHWADVEINNLRIQIEAKKRGVAKMLRSAEKAKSIGFPTLHWLNDKLRMAQSRGRFVSRALSTEESV